MLSRRLPQPLIANGTKPPYYANSRPFASLTAPSAGRFGLCAPTGTAATSLTSTGMLLGSTSGTASATPSLTNATKMYVQYRATASTNSDAGLLANGAGWMQNYQVAFGTGFHWPGESSLRFWAGLVVGNLGGVSTADGASASPYAALAFEASVASTFRFVTGDGTNYTGTALTGDAATPVANHEYSLIIDCRSEPGVAASIYLWDITAGTYTTLRKTTNVPPTSASTNVHFNVVTRTLENAAKDTRIANVWAVTN